MSDLTSYLYLLYANTNLKYSDLKKLLIHYTTTDNIISSALSKKNCTLPEFNSLFHAILAIPNEVIQKNIDYIVSHDIGFIVFENNNYPSLLKSIYDPPIALFYQGNINLLNRFSIGIVGSRNASSSGLSFAFELAKDLSQRSATIVSGLALGIDTQAHKGAIETHGNTVAILGSGFAHIYPKSNYSLAKQIRENGLLLSEFPPLMTPKKYFFPKRNRIINGLSTGTCVIEASKKSGALITAQYAIEESRDVFVSPGNVYSSLYEGSHKLLKEGAFMLTTSNDIIDFYQELSETSVVIEKPLKSSLIQAENCLLNDNKTNNLPTEEMSLYHLIDDQPISITHYQNILQWSSEKLLRTLSKLEIKGFICKIRDGYIRSSFDHSTTKK